MTYYNYKITVVPEMSEIVTAFLGDLGFDTFEETEEGVNAYIPKRVDNENVRETMADLQTQFGFTYSIEEIEPKNWNKEWEANFKPVIVRDFCAVRASFHEPIANVLHELVINPKMAFGTGHHETTYMVIDAMQSLDFQDKVVFDYGCGTGILAILASKLNAQYIDAVDIEEESYLNTIENSGINNVLNINAFEGTLETITGSNYQIILANINRNVILATLSDLKNKLVKGGDLIISGFMLEDEMILRNACEDNGLQVVNLFKRNNWLCMVLTY